MRHLSSIDIDFDIHQLIEAERRGFDEPRHFALRRLLNIPDSQDAAPSDPERARGRPFIQAGVEVPHGSFARMSYQNETQIYEGEFLDGFLVVRGQRYRSLSSAAKALAITKGGKKTSLNGWKYWYAKLPGESEWRLLEDMRSEFLQKQEQN